MDDLTRKCPACGKEKVYANKHNKLNSEKLGLLCRGCYEKNTTI